VIVLHPFQTDVVAEIDRTIFGSWPPFAWNDHAPIPPTLATLRWIKHRQIAYAKRQSAA
jgi:hypothetical protein